MVGFGGHIEPENGGVAKTRHGLIEEENNPVRFVADDGKSPK